MPNIYWFVLLILVILFPAGLMVADGIIGYKSEEKPAKGISGYRRSIIALTIILILGVSIFYLLINTDYIQSKETIENVLSILAGIIAAVAGFYFGNRAAEGKTDELEESIRRIETRVG
jgi:hypothetical protein